MKKFIFPVFLFCIIIVPLLSLYLADKRGAITNPIETESKFVHFISQVVTGNLSPKEKNLLIDRFKEHSLDLKTCAKDLLSKEYGDGSFRCNFYNEVLQDEDWYDYSFGKQSNGDHFSIKIKTGLFEKIILAKYSSGNETVLFEHYIPLRQNKLNIFQLNMTGKHLLILFHNKIFFHLLLKDNVLPGGISFSRYVSGNQKPCRAEYSPIPDEAKIKMSNVIAKIPHLLIKN